jgi:hypothetical protein
MVVSTPVEPSHSVGRASLTEEQFIDRLSSLRQPETVELVRWVFENAPRHNVQFEWGKHTASLKYIYPETGDAFRFGALSDDGRLSITHMVSDRYQKLHLPDRIWRNYLDELANLIAGAKHIESQSKSGIVWNEVSFGEGQDPPLHLLAPKKQRWFELIDNTIKEIEKAMQAVTVT